MMMTSEQQLPTLPSPGSIVAMVMMVAMATGQQLPAMWESCSQFSDLQASILRLMDAHFEYARGLHRLDQQVTSLIDDMTAFKKQFTSLPKEIVVLQSHIKNLSGEFKNLRNGRAPAEHNNVIDPFSSNNLVGSTDSESLMLISKYMQRFISQEYRDPIYRKLNPEHMDFLGFVDNITATVQELGDQQDGLDHRVVRLRRKLRKLSQQPVVLRMTEQGGNEILTGSSGDSGLGAAIVAEEKTRELESKVAYLTTLVSKLAEEKKSSSGGCPTGFIRNMQSCYKFVNTTAHWVDSEKHCQQLNQDAHLVAIETEEENMFLQAYRRYNGAQWSSRYMWTGGTDMIQATGEWTWVSTGQPIIYTRWAPGQPSNSNNNQHCIYIYGDKDAQWDDWHCYAARLNSVCEITLPL